MTSNKKNIDNLDVLISAFVDDVESEEFQAFYRGHAYSDPVFGWRNRLSAYFWPSPEISFHESVKLVEELLRDGEQLASAPINISNEFRMKAEDFAKKVFNWGRVRQKNINGDVVLQVINAAISGEPGNAPMNSGWTKVAAFATGHLEKKGKSQAIWDSRVANSFIKRFDRLLFNAGHKVLPDWMPKIGIVPGRGGTRRKRFKGNLHWPNGYRSWRAHFAASEIVTKIKDNLNQIDMASPSVNTENPIWTVRSVEMVLFMDGY